MSAINEEKRMALTRMVDDTLQRFAQFTPEEFMLGLRMIIQAQGSEQLKSVLDALEIISTESNFADGEKINRLEELARKYPLSWWLEKRETELNRQSIIDYWDFFMVMAGTIGFQAGRIDEMGQNTNLWKATANLARKMELASGRYRHLPAILINNAEQVAKALAEIVDPTAFLEVLVGEAMEDMARSPEFLKAFSVLDEKAEGLEGAISTIMIALQKG